MISAKLRSSLQKNLSNKKIFGDNGPVKTVFLEKKKKSIQMYVRK